jgi:riboflavin synthase
VNLELSLTPSTRMGGHFVSGHIDSVAKLLSYKQIGESYEVFFEIPDYLSKYVVNKGSVCLNGISLTVAKIENQSNVFSVAIIPHTWNETNLKYLKIGDLVNFEVDILSKYTEKLLQTNIGNN